MRNIFRILRSLFRRDKQWESLKLSEQSLEDLCIAIERIRTDRNLYICLLPKHILQPWVLKQLPPRIRR